MEPLINSYKVILFDLDGTLMDSSAAVYDTMLLALQRYGFQPPEGFVYTEIWGKKEVEVLTAVGVPEQYIARVGKEWTRLEGEHGEQITYYDGIPQLLRTLKERGCTVGVVTGRSTDKTRAVPAAQALKDQLDVYVTPDDTSRGKPDPEPVRFALEKLGAAPGEAIFIGDTVVDITMASLAGLISVLATWAWS